MQFPDYDIWRIGAWLHLGIRARYGAARPEPTRIRRPPRALRSDISPAAHLAEYC